ncbi:MAG TPA: hypothetical protein H9825_13340 [Candidatus Sphingobacterium stercorigallinarum]|nr:hypothetical protein [Candidatus Sphingobacterium stercorigallinarum]
MAFNENSRVKIPALLHLMKLGYTYIPLREQIRTEDTDMNGLLRSGISYDINEAYELVKTSLLEKILK